MQMEAPVRRLASGGVVLAALLAVITTGCSSSSPSAPSAATAVGGGGTQSAKTGKGHIVVSCLKSYGITRTDLRTLFNADMRSSSKFSPARLELAGDKCWNPSAGMLAQGVKRIDSCMAGTVHNTTSSGSPLADLLIFISHSAQDRSALKFCLRT
jgi:hypothetical protein